MNTSCFTFESRKERNALTYYYITTSGTILNEYFGLVLLHTCTITWLSVKNSKSNGTLTVVNSLAFDPFTQVMEAKLLIGHVHRVQSLDINR